ncbi:hypothetical protein PYW08_009647 [Mythimna loreyi]|uniref:Uncharacterized protein n=1 Tax=Mythimna loreyi TaxID=667449 RepID=A0ACC2Q6M9_9NEOP|nr:hypothetical protein PYW08_009647 [Mythimna loreyi]
MVVLEAKTSLTSGVSWCIADHRTRSSDVGKRITNMAEGKRVITDLDDCLTVANTCLDKPYIYDFGKQLYDRGLATANALVWKPQRKLLNPAFNQQILNTFFQEYSLQAKRLTTKLSNEAGKETVIGVKPNDHEQEITLKNYAHATDKFFAILEDRIFSVWLHLPVIFNMSNLKKKQDAVIQFLKSTTETIIMNRKSERKQTTYADSVPEATSGYKPILDLLLDIGEKQVFTDEEIREQLDTIIGAAYDTITRAMTFCLILIGTYPKVQARIQEELQEVFDDSDRDLTRHDLPRLVYLEAVLKETLRLYPPVPRVGKSSESPVRLKHYTFPAGTTFFLSLYGMNRHAVWGADANEFNPDRWLSPDTLPDNPNAFATFSIGKRNCIGKQSAMMSMKTTLAYILRRYSVTGDIRNVQCKCDIILKPVSGHYIGLQLRS